MNCISPDEASRIFWKLVAEGSLENLIELSAEGARPTGRISQANRRRIHAFLSCVVSPEPLLSAALFFFSFFPKNNCPRPGGGQEQPFSVHGPGKTTLTKRGQVSRNSTKRRIWKWRLPRFTPCHTPGRRQTGSPSERGANRPDSRLGVSQ